MNFYDLGFSKFLTKSVITSPQVLASSNTTGSIRADDIYGGTIVNSKLNYDYRVYKALVSPIQGDGDFNDIQLAINYVNSQGGGVIKLKPGIYKISDDIDLTSNVTLEGEDNQSTIIDCNNTSSTLNIVGTSGSHITNVTIRNLQITNNLESGAGTIMIYYADDIKIDSVYFYNNYFNGESAQVITCGYGTRITVNKCTGLDTSGMIRASLSNYVYVTENNWDGGDNNSYNYDPIFIQSSSFVTIKSNWISGGTQSCIISDSGTMYDSTISDNYLQGGDTAVVWLVGSQRTQVIGNTVKKGTNGSKGISLVNCDRLITTGNNVYDVTDDGIFLTNTDNCVISGNICNSCGGYGINIDTNTCDNNIVTSNVLINNSGGLNDSGTSTTSANNEV